MQQANSALDGLRVVVVEDEAWIAMMIEDVLLDLGCIVVGVAGNLSQAMGYVDRLSDVDAAVLDVSLGGCDYSYDFADALLEAGAPFVFMTGYAPEFLEPRFQHVPILSKPVTPAALATALAQLPSPKAIRPGA
jgi:CheY-like chemotaxis protein